MKYEWKPYAEIAWAAAIAAATYAVTLAATWTVDDFSDWQTILPALAAGAGRAALGAILPRIGKLFGLT